VVLVHPSASWLLSSGLMPLGADNLEGGETDRLPPAAIEFLNLSLGPARNADLSPLRSIASVSQGGCELMYMARLVGIVSVRHATALMMASAAVFSRCSGDASFLPSTGGVNIGIGFVPGFIGAPVYAPPILLAAPVLLLVPYARLWTTAAGVQRHYHRLRPLSFNCCCRLVTVTSWLLRVTLHRLGPSPTD